MKNLLWPLLIDNTFFFAFIIIYSITWIFHANNIQPELSTNTRKQHLSMREILAICMEMDHYLLGSALDE